jgi:hypothetical protein
MAPTSRSNMIRTRLALIRRVVVLGGMQKGGGNYALKDWAGKMLPALEPHLEMSVQHYLVRASNVGIGGGRKQNSRKSR